MTPQPNQSADTPTAPCVWAAQNHPLGGEARAATPYALRILTTLLSLPSAVTGRPAGWLMKTHT